MVLNGNHLNNLLTYLTVEIHVNNEGGMYKDS